MSTVDIHNFYAMYIKSTAL